MAPIAKAVAVAIARVGCGKTIPVGPNGGRPDTDCVTSRDGIDEAGSVAVDQGDKPSWSTAAKRVAEQVLDRLHRHRRAGPGTNHAIFTVRVQPITFGLLTYLGRPEHREHEAANEV